MATSPNRRGRAAETATLQTPANASLNPLVSGRETPAEQTARETLERIQAAERGARVNTAVVERA